MLVCGEREHSNRSDPLCTRSYDRVFRPPAGRPGPRCPGIDSRMTSRAGADQPVLSPDPRTRPGGGRTQWPDRGLGRSQVVGVGGGEHHLTRLQPQQATHPQISFGVRLGVPEDVTAKHDIPGKSGIFGQVDQERHVAVR